MKNKTINVGIVGGNRAITAAILAAVENSAVTHLVEIHDMALKPRQLDSYLRQGMPELPFKQSYVPILNRKSKRW